MTTIDESIDFIEHQINRTDKSFQDRFVVLLNHKAIGMGGCICMDKENSVFGLYYQFSRVYWGYGYASEAAKALMNYVLDKHPNAVIKADDFRNNK